MHISVSAQLNSRYTKNKKYIKPMNFVLMAKYHILTATNTKTLLFVRQLNDLIFKCLDHGLLIKWEEEAYMASSSMFDILEYLDRKPAQQTLIQFRLAHLAGAFIFLFIGLTMATITFFIERHWFNRKINKTRKTLNE